MGVVGRRALLSRSIALLALGAANLALPLRSTAESQTPSDPMRIPGALPRPYGERSSFVKAARLGGAGPGAPHGWGANSPNNFNSLTPLQDLHGIVTPASLHFERHHNGVPLIDPARHRLLIHGLVERPMIFTVNDLGRFPSVSRLAFLECAGNTWDGWREDAPDYSVQDTHGLMSTSEWTGVKLSTLLEEVGLQREATWILAEGSDAAGLDRSVPLTEEVLREAMICYGQNGRSVTTRARISREAVHSGLRRQHQCEMASATETGVGAVHDAVGDGQIHRPHAGWKSVSVHARDGGEVGDHLPLGAAENQAGVS